MKKLLLLCAAVSVTCLSLATSPQAAAALIPACVPFCCNPDVPDTQKCWYTSGGPLRTCAWYRVPPHSACL